ncbi:uncharacterized protein TNCV_680801 [Trichonephila clavipes]|nr:uncharacterized protein TNCV_680801 [Trichonephila clavipes]
MFARLLDFVPNPYTLDTVDLENPSFLTISENEWRMRHAPTICLRSKIYKSGSLAVLAIPATNSEQPQYALYIQLPLRPHLRNNDTQRYTNYIALSIPNYVEPLIIFST